MCVAGGCSAMRISRDDNNLRKYKINIMVGGNKYHGITVVIISQSISYNDPERIESRRVYLVEQTSHSHFNKCTQ